MKSTNGTLKQLAIENKELRARLGEAEESLLAIRNGDWDALVVSGVGGEQIFTLKQTELRYRRLFEAAQDGILILDAKTGAIKDVNPFLIRMLGYSREEFVEKKLWEVGAFKDIEANRDTFEALQENGYIRYENLPLKTKDGRLVQVEFVSNVYLVDGEKVTQCNIRDITLRKQTEQALFESEKRFRALVENNSSAITMLDARGISIYDSPAVPGMLGYTPKTWIGQNVFALLYPDDLPKVRKLFAKLAKTSGARVNSTFRVRHKSGAWLWIEMVITNLLFEPAVMAMVLNYRDITERMQAEQALAESEQHYRQIIETAGEGIWTIDAANQTTLVNQHVADMLGYTVEEMLGKSVYDFMDEEGKTLTAKSLENRRQGINEQLDFKYKHKDGSAVWALIETSTLLDQNHQYMGALAMLTDITRRKQIEAEIRQRLVELEVLYQSGLTLSQLVSPKAIAQKMIDLLDQKMDWHHSAIRLYHAESDALQLLAFNTPGLTNKTEQGLAEERFKSIERPDQGLTGWVFEHDEVVRTNNLQNDPRYFGTFPGLQSGLYVPIKIGSRMIGVISIESERAGAFSESDERLTITLAAQAAIAIDNALLVSDLQSSNLELSLAYDATIKGWARALDLRDKETEGHSRRVTEIVVKLARAFGLDDAQLLQQIRWGALLHDIGKMGVPDGVLCKPGPLTDEEWVAMKQHPLFAYEMLSPIHYLALALDIPYCHHEKWDGSGYPRGLKGTSIPLTARIFAVVDVWDALSSDRPYRPAWTEQKVREHILAASGTHFDPRVVKIFMQMAHKM